jgi:methionyl-tRNA synthetase
VNFGEHGMRQICSGVRASLTQNDLLGKQGLFVFNLKPRKMMGLESHGMMLFAKNAEGKQELLIPQQPVPNGTQIG